VTTVTAAPPVATGQRAGTREGVAAMLPFVAGYAPFAMAIGAAAAAHGNALAGWAGSWLIYGGSAHLATLRALDGSGLLLAVATGALINARLMIYGASLARVWAGQPLWFRLVAAPMLVDPTWAVATERGADPGSPAADRRFFAAAGFTLGIGWSTMMAIGVVAGDRIASDHLVVAVPLCMASLVAPRLLDPATRWVCVVAGVTSLLTTSFPAGTGIFAAIAAGCAAGALSARRSG
jgi:predicted branched-subunit amino acid permease